MKREEWATYASLSFFWAVMGFGLRPAVEPYLFSADSAVDIQPLPADDQLLTRYQVLIDECQDRTDRCLEGWQRSNDLLKDNGDLLKKVTDGWEEMIDLSWDLIDWSNDLVAVVTTDECEP